MNKIKIGLLIVLVLLGGIDFFLPKEHVAFSAEAIPGFYAVFGFLATALIILVSKIVGLIVLKKEDYYND